MDENRVGTLKESIEAGYEKRSVNIKIILELGAATIVIAVLIYLLMWAVFIYYDKRETSSGKLFESAPVVSLRQKLPPEPRLQTDPQLDLIQLRELEDKELNSYGWIDRDSGTVRIPVDRAIDRLVERGLPVTKQVEDT